MDIYLNGDIFINGKLYIDGILVSGNAITDRMDIIVVSIIILGLIFGLTFIRTIFGFFRVH